MAQASVIIGSNEILGTLWSEIVVRQALNEHWSCSITLRNTLDSRPDVENLLGKPLKISTFTLENGENVIFSGTVVNSQLTYEVTGSYGAVIEAYSDSWKLDQAARYAYFKKESGQQAANTILSNNGMALTGSIPSQPEMTYVQWEETDYQFILRLVDDAEAWLRPSSESPGLDVQTAFQAGPTLDWRQGEHGLLEWQTQGRLRPLLHAGTHYDSLPMTTQSYSGVKSDTAFYGGAAEKMVSAVKQQGESLPAASVADRNRAITLDHYQDRLQKESRRALASAVICSGVSREPRVKAGDTVVVAGLSEVDASYGVITCTHRWTPKGYENQFTATPAQRWFQANRHQQPKVEGLYPAKVVANHDPHNQGRIRVQYWWQQESDSTWVRLISAHAGADRGILFLPEVGDEVAIAFEGGDVERPYILGSLWTGVNQPPSAGYMAASEVNGSEFAGNNIKRIVTKSGHRITLADNPGQETMTLATPKNVRITMTEKASETGRPALVLESAGDILFSAPNGRIHFHSATRSSETGDASKKAEAVTAAPAAPGQKGVSASGVGKTTTITNVDGSKEVRRGSRPWRDNNPGDIEIRSGDKNSFASRHGAIGKEGGVYAIFPDKQTGQAALHDLLKTKRYQSSSIKDAMKIFAPASDNNDPTAYANSLAKSVGMPADTKLSDLSEEQMSNFMKEIGNVEGYNAGGTSTVIPGPAGGAK